ncbi:hypothetical protein EDD21DRAFT_421816 [Dissophora ornata]|nr:hypothetical protein EDD21DRAFT_421816 [Dissophora ornata]
MASPSTDNESLATQVGTGEIKINCEPSMQTQAWRATVNAMKYPNALRRCYIKDTKDTKDTKDISYFAKCSDTEPTEPWKVNSGNERFCRLAMDSLQTDHPTDLQIGHYEIVVCVSFEETNLQDIKEISFDTKSVCKKNLYYSMVM